MSFEDFDIGSVAKIIVDETKERTELMCMKPLAKESEVFLIDHAWTFRFQDAIDTLKSHPQLVERLTKMTDNCEKMDLP